MEVADVLDALAEDHALVGFDDAGIGAIVPCAAVAVLLAPRADGATLFSGREGYAASRSRCCQSRLILSDFEMI